jgi:ligand-binding SRPBCC domain-containing protein
VTDRHFARRPDHDARSARTSVFVYRSVVCGTAADVFRWHERPEALLDLLPQSRWMRIERRTGGLHEDGRVAFSVGVGPLRAIWEARHYGYVPGKQFCDEQIRGPFALWRHIHRVEALGPDRCLYEDRVEYTMPGGALGRRIAGPLVEYVLSREFARRHRIVGASFTAAPASAPEDVSTSHSQRPGTGESWLP